MTRYRRNIGRKSKKAKSAIKFRKKSSLSHTNVDSSTKPVNHHSNIGDKNQDVYEKAIGRTEEELGSQTMSKSRLITRSVTRVRPAEMTLNLECVEEPLSDAQLTFRSKYKENFEKVSKTLEDLVKERGGKLIQQTDVVCGYEYTLPSSAPPQPVVQSNAPPQVLSVNQSIQNKAQPIKLNVLKNPNPGQGNIQLVMDPRMGVILGTVSTQGSTPGTTTPIATATSQPQTETYKPPNPRVAARQRTKVMPAKTPDIIEEPLPPQQRARVRPAVSTHVVTPKATTTPHGVQNLRIKTVNKQPTQLAQHPTRPTEDTSIGGIAVGSKHAVGEHIDESKKHLPDGREITFNKINGGRTFPSLVVVARPNLCTKNVTPQFAQKERQDLDLQVKSVLMYSATKFAEWLIQQGLVRSEQYCMQHSTNYQKVKLELGMYSDTGTFPYSGGYVWISSCCPDRFVSVFSGSIFQGAPHTPTVLLKLIYHWACQTNIQNVVSWVKVSNVYVKNFYTNLRSICTAAVWDKSRMMGGKNSMIQVGVISLGTTSQDGNLRQVKVEVLGVLDPDSSELRLRACEPVIEGERSYKRRFNNILSPLKDWVHKDSKILTDFTVDKSTLQEMGFTNVTQSAFSEQTPRNVTSNYHIMEYLRKIVPRMFQNTLSLLSRQMIQQFLDELVWREMFGSTAAKAFNNIIIHIAEQTKLDTSENLLERITKISANPFHDWSYTTSNPPPLAPMVSIPKEPSVHEVHSRQDVSKNLSQVNKRNRKRVWQTRSPEPEIKRRTPDFSAFDKENKIGEKVQLQEFYYATMEGKGHSPKEHKNAFLFKCFLCPATMRSNSEVMEHMISHVPRQVPGQSESPVCRYCCSAFSSQHQMVTHVTEAHSTFGHSDSDMVVCAICEHKFGNSSLLVNHLSMNHYPSEMPYRCETCAYRTSSHKDVIDHYYKVHENGEGLQCPYCLKVVQFVTDGVVNAPSIHAFLLHMQRHVVRRDEGRGNKCTRCCLWFNQRSSLKNHQQDLHDYVSGSKVVPYKASANGIMITRQRPQVKKFERIGPSAEATKEIKKWNTGPIRVNLPGNNFQCQECEEDIDEIDHYPGEQRCQQCRYVTCCWRAFKEHQQQIHNERPKTTLVVPSPLITIPLEKKMQCPCSFATNDGNLLAAHLVKCKRVSACPVENTGPSGMLDSLGLVPKSFSEGDVSKRNGQRPNLSEVANPSKLTGNVLKRKDSSDLKEREKKAGKDVEKVVQSVDLTEEE
ncbi:uncharacterized protein LOC117168099 isoform X3 [Belonocnema kinseyi]|uniref:uncharacterized protein LOC117168099 isoform X3 n=1 Tax=Belonocnema kinseyi TaxID=2817044 RepID=UPI00143D9189|nr:uncharacterized protein LOC117168099 isoform X3 [Belonocnema kinseyi]